MTLRQHQVKRVKSQLVETGGINDWNEYHAADEEEDEHFHYHTMHWVPVYETLDHSSQSRVAVIDTNIQVQCRITHARILCIFARWISHCQDIVAQHFEVMDHRKGLFDDDIDNYSETNQSAYNLKFLRGRERSELASSSLGKGTSKSKFKLSLSDDEDDDVGPSKYDWDIDVGDIGAIDSHSLSNSVATLLGSQSKRGTVTSAYTGADEIDEEGRRSYNSSLALAYYHRLTGGGVDAVQSRIDHFNDYVSLVDLEEEEAYLRYRLIEHCLFRVKQIYFTLYVCILGPNITQRA